MESSQQEQTLAPQRHGCLTAALLVFGVLTVLAALANLALHDRIAGNLINGPAWASQGVIAMGLLGIVAAVAIFGLWQWRRWGLFLYVVVGLIVFGINVSLVGMLPSLLGLVGVVLITTLVMRQWQDFH